MTIETAREILQLPENPTRAQINESYRQLRMLYEPRHYGQPRQQSDQQILEHLYQHLSGSEGVQLHNPPLRGYEAAFIRYAKVCLAYDVLTAPKNVAAQEEALTPRGCARRRFEKIAKKAREMAYVGMVLSLLMFLVCGFLWVFAEVNLCETLSKVFLGVSGLLLLTIWLSLPLDTLLFIPKRIWNGVRAGASVGIWLTKPITVVLCGVLCGFAGLLGLFFAPGMICLDRDERYECRDMTIRRDRAGAREWFDKTKQNLQMLSAACGDGVVKEKMTYVQKLLQSTAAACREAREELERTCEDSERKIRKVQKKYDFFTDSWGILGDDPLDIGYDLSRRLDEVTEDAQKNIAEEQSAYGIAFWEFSLIAVRLGVDPADYGVEI